MPQAATYGIRFLFFEFAYSAVGVNRQRNNDPESRPANPS